METPKRIIDLTKSYINNGEVVFYKEKAKKKSKEKTKKKKLNKKRYGKARTKNKPR